MKKLKIRVCWKLNPKGIELGTTSANFKEASFEASRLFKTWASNNPEKVGTSWIEIDFGIE